MHDRTARTDSYLDRLPQWAQEFVVSYSLERARENRGIDGLPFSLQSALENTLDMVYCDLYVIARIKGEPSLMHALDFPVDTGRPSAGTIIVERPY